MARRAVERSNAYIGGGHSDAVGRRLKQQNFHKFLRWIACARIRLLTDRMCGAVWEARRIKDTVVAKVAVHQKVARTVRLTFNCFTAP